MRAENIRSWFVRRRVLAALLILLVALVVLTAFAYFLPFTLDGNPVSNPATNHQDALERVDLIRAEEQASGLINPLCESLLLTHGATTENVIVFFHGFTSCPEQFRVLGQNLFDLGYNVYIPRLPHHGHADRDRNALLNTSAEELSTFATDSIDIANGLGDRIVISGLSGGGTIAAWLAQQRDDVDRAVVIAPFLGIGFIPAVINRPVTRILDDIPNFDMWWDPRSKENNPHMAAYAYPGYPIHALAEYLRLGQTTQEIALREPPGASSISAIINANDSSVNNSVTDQLVEAWQVLGEEGVSRHEFLVGLNLPHDVITPSREDGDPAAVYPVVIDSILQNP